VKRRARWLLGIAISLVAVTAGLGATLRFAPRHTPPGQPPLERLDAQALNRLRARFNDGAHTTRLLLLLSPT